MGANLDGSAVHLSRPQRRYHFQLAECSSSRLWRAAPPDFLKERRCFHDTSPASACGPALPHIPAPSDLPMPNKIFKETRLKSDIPFSRPRTALLRESVFALSRDALQRFFQLQSAHGHPADRDREFHLSHEFHVRLRGCPDATRGELIPAGRRRRKPESSTDRIYPGTLVFGKTDLNSLAFPVRAPP